MLPAAIPTDIDKYFFNRSDEIAKIMKYVTSIHNNLASQVLVLGGKGVGKTFFVKKVLHDLNDDILTIFVDLSNIYGVNREIKEEEILKEILSKLNEHLTGDGRLNRLKSMIESGIQNLAVNKYDLTESVDLFNMSVPKIKKDYSKLSRLVMDLLQNIVDTADEISGVVIAFDEFQLIDELENPDAFLMLIRSSIKNQQNVCYIYTGNFTSFSDVAKIIKNGFGGRMPHFYLKPFTIKDTIAYIEKYASDLRFTDDGYERFYECTLGVPSYINSFANVLRSDVVYDRAKIDETYIENIDRIASVWITIWMRFSSKQKEIITLLIDKGSVSFDDMMDETNLSEEDLKNTLYNMFDMDVVFEDGEYSFDNEMIKMWLLNEKKTKGFYPP